MSADAQAAKIGAATIADAVKRRAFIGLASLIIGICRQVWRPKMASPTGFEPVLPP